MDQALCLPLHPLGVKPAGNAYTSTQSLSNPLQSLPDGLVVQILELLDFRSLLDLGRVCKALFAFSRMDELWKTFCLE